jgi:hypothetical protein
MDPRVKSGIIALAAVFALAVVGGTVLLVAILPRDDAPRTSPKPPQYPPPPVRPADSQDPFPPSSTEEQAKALAALAVYWTFGAAYLVGAVAVVVWLGRDAQARGYGPAGWAAVFAVPQLAFLFPFWAFGLLPLFFPRVGLVLVPWLAPLVVFAWTGLVVYLLVRRGGTLVSCERCPGKRLEYASTCPHCGHAVAELTPELEGPVEAVKKGGASYPPPRRRGRPLPGEE